ncbi:Brp/Blh family beta-carotene 15,15'-dioxygenase [Dermatophilaceae bacterium Soc4.6]
MAALPVLTILPVCALAALVLLSVLAPEVARSLALPVAVAGAAVGIPHGAVDHLVPWWWSEQRVAARPHPGRLRLTVFVVAYAAAAGLAFAASLAVPTVTYVVFLLLSSLHFGRGEVVTNAERAGRPVPGPRQEWATTLAPGLVVVGLLLWARPADTDVLLRPVSPVLADAVSATATSGLVVVGAAVLLALAVQLRRRRVLDAAELSLLVVAFAVAPPLAAFGLWFGLWHAVRHTGRLLDLARTDSAQIPSARDWRRAVRRLTVAGALPTVIALGAVAVLWAVHEQAGLRAEIGILLALTFPHTAVVGAWDRHQSRRAPATPTLTP